MNSFAFRKILLALCLLINLQAYAQWSDNFIDGNFTDNPVWIGDTSNFVVNTGGELQLDASDVTTSSYISTASNVFDSASWEFYARMEFNPSSSNYSKVFLVADSSDLSTTANGYFLRIGHTNDNLCLFRKKGTTESLLVDGRPGMFNSTRVNARVKVTRTGTGDWDVYCDSTGGNQFQLVGNIRDTTVFKAGYFGIQCFYTSTRANKFFFDDFVVTGKPYVDSTIPYIKDFKVTDEHTINLRFSEALDTLSARNPANFSFENNSVASISYILNENALKLTFENGLTCNSDNFLSIKHISDVWGTEMKDTTINFNYCRAKPFDVVFNEIMADPSPPFDLPEAEYIELFNRSGKTIRLENWTLKIGSTKYLFPEYQMRPGAYLVLTSVDNVNKFEDFGSVLGLWTSSSALANTGQFLQLFDGNGQLISWVNYSDTWYKDDFKKDGGWSLEQKDPFNPCGEAENWDVSNSTSGGTPGKINSIARENADFTSPELLWVKLKNDSVLTLVFNENLDSLNSLQSTNFTMLPSLKRNLAARRNTDDYSAMDVILPAKPDASQIYTLTVSSRISDCAGNHLSGNIDYLFQLPVKPDSLDVILNEVLFDAYSGASDYIELYNKSDHFLDISGLMITYSNGDGVDKTLRISNDHYLFAPRSYLVVCSDAAGIAQYYITKDERRFFEVPQLTSLNDKSGTISVLSTDFSVLDKFSYTDKMHVPTLRNTEGISLERVNPDLPTMFTGNWHSAAETVGYGTPGLINSQIVNEQATDKEIKANFKIFSPDNDGYKDVFPVYYSLATPGARASVIIFDSSGRKMRNLLNNELLATKGSFSWDGIANDGSLCSIGLYLVFVRLVYSDGTVKDFKLPCVITKGR